MSRSAAIAPYFEAIQNEWRTQPTDLGGWANRASQMKLLAERLHAALDFIAADATITPAGCPEPWRSTLIEWVEAANHALEATRT